MKTQKLQTQRGDTIHLVMKTPSNFQYDESLFNTKLKLDDHGQVISETFVLQNTPKQSIFGLSECNIVGDKLDLKFSGKILGDDYFEGITLDTIPIVVKEINKVSGMNITTNGILTESTMRVFDNTFNLELDDKDCIGDYVKSIQFGSVGNTKLLSNSYGDDSIVLRLDTTTTKNRMIFYNKLVELQKKDKEFYRIYNTDKFIDTLRVEMNICDLPKMRMLYDIPAHIKPNLNMILSNKNNSLLKQFTRFVDTKTSQQILYSIDTMKNMEYKDKREMHEKFFLEYHYDLFKGDIGKIFELYKDQYSDNRVPYRQKTTITKLLKEYEIRKVSKKNKSNYTKKFNEIHKKLQLL